MTIEFFTYALSVFCAWATTPDGSNLLFAAFTFAAIAGAAPRAVLLATIALHILQVVF